MDPVSLMAITTLTTMAAGGVAAYGAMKTGSATAESMKYQAGIAQINQQIAAQNRDYAYAAGDVEAQKSGMRSRYQIGKIITSQAARGVSGEAPDAVVSSQQKIAQMDQRLIRQNAAQRAWGYEVEAAKATAEQRLMERSAENVKSAAKIQAIGSLLGTASSVSSKWMQAKMVGIGEGSTQKLGYDDEGY